MSKVRTRARPRWLVLAALCLSLLLAAIAVGGSESRQDASYLLTQEKPGRGTSERLRFDYVNPDDREGKPPAVRRVVTVLPRGGRFDTSVPAICEATDAELMAIGGDACPAGSAIGGGVITVDTGVPGPGRFVEADTEFFNNSDEFIYVNTVRESGARVIVRAEVRRRRTITNADMLPGTPPEGGAIDTVDVTVAGVSRRIDGERRHYISTPDRCPATRRWTTKVRFTYADGESQLVRTRDTCKRRRDF